ncbi:UDP-3-O-[3-hydroxymyristoyl] N-acetylglucosamine deacetylase [Hoeflea marina]|uniref:UDP-3-O-acyl-N-acetylglucosamine deacetylase n=2 Tax=Hoeflea marina TaxID=274592 RepID=A0A317PKV6_9HYPH|nr:UDP-3-O-[3-hydroxymyristoyl] N-acetylglucosamine deacetylase [Hoeflea marina]
MANLMGIDVVGYQTTIARSTTLSGIGVHSGENVSISFHPADPDTGIVFNRSLDNGDVVSVRAVSSQVGSTDLCTLLGKAPDRSIATVEHLMAALYAMGIDNVAIDIDAGEVPIMDGSAAVFIEAFDSAGLTAHAVKRRYIRVTKPVRIEMGGSWAEFTPHNGTRFEIDIDFDTPLIGRQSWKGEVTADTFRRELARARTFGFMRDVERLWASGHALGSSLENSVVISDDDKVINIEGLRYRDEFVRHKTLDAVGDLALAGAQFIGCYRSYRGGHRLNAMALRALLADSNAYDVVEAPARRNSVRHGELVAVSAPVFAPWSV